MNDLLKKIILALAGIFLVDFTCFVESLNENNINSSEPINNINYTVQSENNNNNSSSNNNSSLNEQVANNTDNKILSLSSGNAMELCNQTFQTPKEYFIEMNLTGTLPNEIDSSSMCFIHCYLMKIGVLKNDMLDRERADVLRLARNEDILDDCAKESRDQKEQCLRAYVFLRCVTILNLIFDEAK